MSIQLHSQKQRLCTPSLDSFFPNPIIMYITSDVLLVVIETLMHLDSYETSGKYPSEYLVNGFRDSLRFTLLTLISQRFSLSQYFKLLWKMILTSSKAWLENQRNSSDTAHFELLVCIQWAAMLVIQFQSLKQKMYKIFWKFNATSY